MSVTATHDPMLPVAEAAVPTAPAPAERRGCANNALRHGVRGGDPNGSSVPRCGAKTRAGSACKAPAIRARARCRLHGGLSTGPKSTEGRARIAAANTKHGARSGAMRALLEQLRQTRIAAEALVAQVVAQRQGRAEPADDATTTDLNRGTER